MKRVKTLLPIILFIVFGLAAFAPADSLDTNYQLTSTGLYKYPNGIIYDPKTKLEWYMGPDRDMDWYEASRWVKDLKIGGGKWEMPKSYQLAKLCKKGRGSHNIDPAFVTTGWFYWAGVYYDDEDMEYGFDFYYIRGYELIWPKELKKYWRVIAVRKRK